MVKCEWCGAILEDDELVHSETLWLRSDGLTFKEETCDCPNCGHTDFVDIIECRHCGEPIEEGEDIDGLCNKCFEAQSTSEYLFNVDDNDFTEDISINFALAHLFSVTEIEEILKNEAQKIPKDILNNKIKKIVQIDERYVAQFMR